MNYRQIYDNLMAKARLRGLDKAALKGYYEKHHVMPRCLGGGDEDGNLVLLTFKEHKLAHRLLTKICTGRAYYQMLSAYRILIAQDLPGRSYKASELTRAREAHSMAMKVFAKEYCNKLAARGEHPWQTEEHKAATSKRMTKRQNDKVSKGEHAWQTAEHAESRRQAITAMNKSDANPSRKHENRLASSLRLKAKHTCQFCKYTGRNIANMKRYHFANCKSLTSHAVATNKATGDVHKFLTEAHAWEYVSKYKAERGITKRGGWSFELKGFSLLVC